MLSAVGILCRFLHPYFDGFTCTFQGLSVTGSVSLDAFHRVDTFPDISSLFPIVLFALCHSGKFEVDDV